MKSVSIGKKMNKARRTYAKIIDGLFGFSHALVCQL
jgi:hypothetical protein